MFSPTEILSFYWKVTMTKSGFYLTVINSSSYPEVGGEQNKGLNV